MQVLGNSYLVYRYFKYNNLHEFLMQLYLHNVYLQSTRLLFDISIDNIT